MPDACFSLGFGVVWFYYVIVASVVWLLTTVVVDAVVDAVVDVAVTVATAVVAVAVVVDAFFCCCSEYSLVWFCSANSG